MHQGFEQFCLGSVIIFLFGHNIHRIECYFRLDSPACQAKDPIANIGCLWELLANPTPRFIEKRYHKQANGLDLNRWGNFRCRPNLFVIEFTKIRDKIHYFFWLTDDYTRINVYSFIQIKRMWMVSKTLAQEVCQLEADLCSSFADPTRILILYALDERPRNVTELTLELQITQPTTSRHLRVLREKGLVIADRQGTTITYHLSDKRLIQALDLLRSVLRDRIAHRASLMEEAVT